MNNQRITDNYKTDIYYSGGVGASIGEWFSEFTGESGSEESQNEFDENLNEFNESIELSNELYEETLNIHEDHDENIEELHEEYS